MYKFYTNAKSSKGHPRRLMLDQVISILNSDSVLLSSTTNYKSDCKHKITSQTSTKRAQVENNTSSVNTNVEGLKSIRTKGDGK